MWATFKATVVSLVRNPQVMVWTAVFPIVLSTIFSFMFSSLANDGTVDAVSVAVVSDDDWETSVFSQQVDALSSADVGILDVREVPDADEARALLNKGEVTGFYELDGEGTPRLVTSPTGSGADAIAHSVNVSILETVASAYVQGRNIVEEVAAKNPAALADRDALQDLLSDAAGVREVSLTHGTPDETVRYYYALLGMTALFGAMLATWSVTGSLPTSSALGARRALAPIGRAAQLAGVLLGSWAIAMACLLVALLYMRVVVGVAFAGREALCLVGLAATSLLATGIGTLVGALPLNAGMRSGINTAISCGGSLFAGLYGQPSMGLADAVAAAVPAEAWLNPARLISDLFYALYYYDSLAPFLLRLAACVAYALALFAVSGVLVGRTRYEHL